MVSTTKRSARFRTGTRVGVLFALVVSMLSFGAVSAANAEATATVSGVLRSPEFPTRPAPGQHYVGVSSSSGGPLHFSAAPDAQGRFSIPGIPPGRYTIQVGANTESWYVGQSGGLMPRIEDVVLSAGQQFVIDTPVPYERNPLQTTETRLSGADRFDTAVQVSQSAYDAGVPVVYLVSGLDFADALSAAPAAAADGGPLLLTPPDGLTQTAKNEIARLTPDRVVIVGGVNAVGTNVEDQVRSSGIPVERISGADRFATSLAVAERRPLENCGAAFIATGRSFPDALSISPMAGNFGGPLILVDGAASSLAGDAQQALQRMDCRSVMIAGGTGAVSAGIESSIRGLNSSVSRFAGETRYATSMAINKFAGEHPHAYFASGENFPDALAAAAVIGVGDASLYLTTRDCVPQPLHDLVTSRNPALVTLVGGPSALSDAVASHYSSPC